MSNVIVFKPDRSRSAQHPPDADAADILFFTGVRYVPWNEADDADAGGDRALLLEREAREAAAEERLQA